MSETLGKAVLELVGNLAPLSASLEKGKLESEAMAKSTASGFKNGITKAAVPAALAVGLLAVGLHKSVDAAEADQAASARLAVAYKAAGLNADHYKGSIDGAVQSSAALGFKSNEVKTALGSLIIATGSNKKAMKDLSIAQDIARFKGISLTAATKMLTMAQVGSTRAVKQLGLTVVPVTTAQDKLKAATKDHTSEAYKNALAVAKQSDVAATAAQVNDVLTQKLHGQAQAFADTAAGAKEKMGAEFQLLEENIGKMLIPALTAIASTLASATEWMSKHATVAKILIGIVGALALAILGVNVALKLQAVYTKLAAAAQWLWNAALDANPIGLIIIAIAALVAAFIILWDHSKTFRQIILGVWDDVKAGTNAFLAFFTQTVPDAFHKVIHWLSNTWTSVSNLVSQPFKDAWSFIKGVPGDITGAFGTIGHDLGRVFGAIGGIVKAAFLGPIDMVIAGINAIELPTSVHIKTWHGIPDGFSIGWSSPFHIPQLAEGGIVDSPTLALIGEAGPEAVVPLGSGGLGSGGIVVNVSGVVGNERDVALKIGRELQKLNNRGLNFGLT